jgi:Family of unknown function (DUF6226)
VIPLPELQAAVEVAFVATGSRSPPWPDPNPDRSSVPDEAYSRLTDPAKWRILGARTDAWLIALVQAGIATVEPDATATWATPPGPVISRRERAMPLAVGALPLVVAHSRIGAVDDAGLVLGVGDPAECINRFPDCGCDACDSGSQLELDHLDAHIVSVVTGSLRRLSDGGRVITVLGPDSWSASDFHPAGPRIGRQVESVLADPRGWHELRGRSWLDTTT